ncbi:BLUF domain-containing protein [Rubrivivax rivuli]|uniref:BLUF domain-containing protein n=1 Tax=Rubrivivax rivuli TaxID=1862385 RepID=UPI0013E3C6D7|nr:BLUF domain-containing protein [Rubrivivax rivuli]
MKQPEDALNRRALSQLVYRSRATRELAPQEVQALLETARARNAREQLTGLLVLDGGRFFQWLEGPREALERVWASIQRDHRHHSIERLQTPWRAERLFADWHMQCGSTQALPEVPGTWALPAEVSPARVQRGDEIPAYLSGLALWAHLPPPAQMAEALLADDETQARALGDRVARLQPDAGALGAHVLGPVSRAMAAAWQDDRCTGTQLVVAQGRLQTLMRQACPLTDRGGSARPEALVALWPGETHLAGVTFAGIALDGAGWAVRCAFPARLAELEDLLARQAVDLLHIAISPVFCRDEQLPAIAAAVRRLRQASAQPRLMVVLGGQAFQDLPGLAVVLGADDTGLEEGSTAMDLRRMQRWTQVRSRSPGAMVAQALLNDVTLNMQRRLFGVPEEEQPLQRPGGSANDQQAD